MNPSVPSDPPATLERLRKALHRGVDFPTFKRRHDVNERLDAWACDLVARLAAPALYDPEDDELYGSGSLRITSLRPVRADGPRRDPAPYPESVAVPAVEGLCDQIVRAGNGFDAVRMRFLRDFARRMVDRVDGQGMGALRAVDRFSRAISAAMAAGSRCAPRDSA